MTTFFEKVAQVDSHLASPPCHASVSTLVALMSDPEVFDYAFETMEDPTWLPHMLNAGFFDHPTAPIKTDKGTTYKWWPPGRYLFRVAKNHPTFVPEALLRVPATANFRVVLNLAEAANHVSIEVAAEWTKLWIPRIAQFDSLESLLVKQLAALAKKLLSHDVSLGLALATVLIEPTSSEPAESTLSPIKTRIETYWYDDTLKILTPSVLELRMRGFHWAVERLSDLLAVSTPPGRWDDGSEYWFGHWAHREHDPRRCCARLVVATARALWADGDSQAEVALSLAGLRWPIGAKLLMRLATANRPQVSILRSLIERYGFWDRIGLDSEQVQLLRTAGECLPEGERQAIVERVARGPEEWVLRRWRERIDPEHLEGAITEWKTQRMVALGLVEPAVASQPEDQQEESTDWSSLSPEDVAATVLATEDVPRPLCELIKKDPSSYAGLATAAQGRNSPRLWTQVLLAFVDSLGQETAEPVPLPVLELANMASRSGDREAARWAVRIVDRAIDPGKQKRRRLLREHESLAWEIIEAASEVREEIGRTESGDPYSRAINSVRPVAVEAAIRLGLWCQERDNLGALDPRVQGLLEKQLSAEFAWDAVHAMLGEWLPWLVKLDKAWVEKNLRGLSPTRQQQYLADALWQQYLRHSLYTDVYALLSTHYRELIADRCGNWNGRENSIPAGLARHVMAVHWRFLEPSGSELVAAFYESASSELRRYALDFVGRALKNTDTLEESVHSRLRTLWEARVRWCQKSGDWSEMEAISTWVWSGHMNKVWGLRQLTIALRGAGKVETPRFALDFIVAAREEHPDLSFDAFAALIDSKTDDWLLRHGTDWQPVLADGLRNPETFDQAVELANKLGRQGYWQLKSLFAPYEGDSSASQATDKGGARER